MAALTSGPDRELRPWAKFLRGCAKEGLTGFVYFNNDMNTRAPLNALRLMELVGPSAVQTCPVHSFSRRRVETLKNLKLK